MRINLRLNQKKDKDIINALDNSKNLSEEVRKLLRRGIGNSSVDFSVTEAEDDYEMRVINVDSQSLESLKNNLISNDFGF